MKDLLNEIMEYTALPNDLEVREDGSLRIWLEDSNHHGHYRRYYNTAYGVFGSSWCVQYGNNCVREDKSEFLVIVEDLGSLASLARSRIDSNLKAQLITVCPTCGRAYLL